MCSDNVKDSATRERARVRDALKPLYDLIGAAESNNNYEAYFGHPDNVDDPRLTEMTLLQVLAWQGARVASGSRSSAAGRYQIIRKTLLSLLDEMDLTGSELFDAAMQDAMARTLLERRGLEDFLTRRITVDEFGDSLAREWAALPLLTGSRVGESYYAGDGLNRALVSPSQLRQVLEAVLPRTAE